MKKDDKNENSSRLREKEITWVVPEYYRQKKTTGWYIAACAVLALLLVYCLWTKNFLFAIILVLGGIIIILNDGAEPQKVRIRLDDDGVTIGKKIYDYDELRNFAVVHRPKEGVKNLYFEFKNTIRHRLSIPLEDEDPWRTREFLLRYLDEDFERTDRPMSEKLAKFLKL